MAKILLVDDDPTSIMIVSKMLEVEGHTIVKANDGKGAIALLKKQKDIDLVITDMVMPNIDGKTLIICIKRMFPKIKIIVITGAQVGESKSYLEIARKMGANKAFSKPVDGRFTMAVNDLV